MILWLKFVRERDSCIRAVGDKKTGTIRPDFDRSISIDFQGAKITADTGFLLMREIKTLWTMDCLYEFERYYPKPVQDLFA